MNEEIQKRLAEFMKSRKPDSTAYLHNFKEEILYLYQHGYSYKLIHQYLSSNGVGCAYSTFIKWARENITPLLNVATPMLHSSVLNSVADTTTNSDNAASSAVTNNAVNEQLPKDVIKSFAGAKLLDADQICGAVTNNVANEQLPINAIDSFAPAKLLDEQQKSSDESSIDPKEVLAKKLAESKARLEASLGKSPKQLISEAKKL